MKLRLVSATGALLLGSLILSACDDSSSDNGSDIASRPTAASTSETVTTSAATSMSQAAAAGSSSGEQCTILSGQDLSSAVGGTPVTVNSAGADICFYAIGSGDANINLIDIALDVDQYVQGTRATCTSPPVDVQAGDTAFVCTRSTDAVGYVVKGRKLATLVVKLDSPAACAAAVTKALPKVNFG
ncbi:hypothetical protein [Williamsia sp. CHRR-6]|uniref:hypothetical protein n=1 Tax=Williamsia sp. CHRR-6 TaxID=2835871 RepID=UPI001BDA3143|nr:hypothetical protein [Williamsia sp. CHRR-6]MBT0567560.1 hypothetical protein [Williamsia sp. CHRR-6]